MNEHLIELKRDIYQSRYARVSLNNLLRTALMNEKVKKHVGIVKRLKELSEELKKYPWSYERYTDIDFNKQEEMVDMQKEIYMLLCNI